MGAFKLLSTASLGKHHPFPRPLGSWYPLPHVSGVHGRMRRVVPSMVNTYQSRPCRAETRRLSERRPCRRSAQQSFHSLSAQPTFRSAQTSHRQAPRVMIENVRTRMPVECERPRSMSCQCANAWTKHSSRLQVWGEGCKQAPACAETVTASVTLDESGKGTGQAVCGCWE
eukprot:3907892-Rhodomonas_salina.2